MTKSECELRQYRLMESSSLGPDPGAIGVNVRSPVKVRASPNTGDSGYIWLSHFGWPRQA
jgi:hypothetical protein